MTDTAPTAPTTTTAPEVIATPAPAPAPTPAPAAAPVLDYNELAQALIRNGAVPATPAAPAAPPAAKPVADVNLFQVGQLVKHSHYDVYDGRTRTAYGIVIEVLANQGAGARSRVAWFHEASGPIGDEQLEAV